MYSYFDHIPSELFEEVVYYIEDYDTLIDLHDNYSNIKTLIKNNNFWRKLFRNKLSYLLDSININFSDDVYYLIASYSRAIIALNKLNNLIKYYTNIINVIIKSKYPEMSFGKCDIKKLLLDIDVLSFRSKGFYLNLETFYIKDLGLLLNTFKKGIYVINGIPNTNISKDHILKHFSKNISNKIKLVMIPEGWGISLEIPGFGKIVSMIQSEHTLQLLFGQIFMSGNDLFDKFIKK